MAYTPPTTRTTADLITASIWNTDIVDNIAYLYSIIESGYNAWTAAGETWVYVSASSFKIVGVDKTAKYKKGTKIKFTQTTGKYAVVASSSFSTDTTITIYVNTDHTIANATITAPYFSYSTPPDFPEWFSIASPAMTSLAAQLDNGSGGEPTCNYVKYRVDGNLCTVKLHYNGTKAGANTTLLGMADSNFPAILAASYATGSKLSHVGSGYVLGSAQQVGAVIWSLANTAYYLIVNTSIADNDVITDATATFAYQI